MTPEEIEEYKMLVQQRDKHKAYMKEYNSRPEIIEKNKQYRRSPQEKERRNKYQREYRMRPEVKERYRLFNRRYRERPEVKKKYIEYQKKYQAKRYNDPIYRKRILDQQKEYNKTPRRKEKMRLHNKKSYEENRKKFIAIWGEANLGKPKKKKNKDVFRY